MAENRPKTTKNGTIMTEIRHKYFTIGELLHSDTAIENKIDNYSITTEQEANLDALIINILDPAREEFGKAIIVTNGWRCSKLNTEVKGVKNSQHPKGEAADLQTKDPKDLPRLFDILSKMDVDQLLYETNSKGVKWIHVSYKRTGNRQQVIQNLLKR